MQVAVSFDATSSFTASYRGRVVADLSSLVETRVGRVWDATVEELDVPALGSRLSLETLDVTPLPADETAWDKRFFLLVSRHGSGCEVAGREWDGATRELGPTVVADTADARGVPATLYGLLVKTFRPVLVMESADLGTREAKLRLKAGAFVPESAVDDPAADPIRVQVRPGDLLLAVIQYFEKDGSLRQNQLLPWTYLIVTGVERGRVTSSITTGIRPPLGAKQSKRVRTIALATRPLYDMTRVQLRLRRNTARRLAAHDVLVASSPKLADEPESKLGQFFTNRQGTVELPVFDSQPVVWIYVKSGDQLLAKLPYAPGLEPFAEVDLPDDEVRLSVEGEVAQVKSALVDTVARRAAAMIRARALAKVKNWDGVDRELKKLDALPTREVFRERLNQVRLPAVDEARDQKNRVAERKIQELCDEVNLLVERYLDPKKTAEFKEDIKSVRP